MQDEHGDPWFVALDVCAMLGLANVSRALDALDDDEVSTAQVVGSNGRMQPNTNIVSESGLYSLILRSRRPEAKAIRRWVTGTVLPSIRRTGSYGHGNLTGGRRSLPPTNEAFCNGAGRSAGRKSKTPHDHRVPRRRESSRRTAGVTFTPLQASDQPARLSRLARRPRWPETIEPTVLPSIWTVNPAAWNPLTTLFVSWS